MFNRIEPHSLVSKQFESPKIAIKPEEFDGQFKPKIAALSINVFVWFNVSGT